MKQGYALTEDEIARIRGAYPALSIPKLAELWGLHVTTVRRHVVGRPRRKRKKRLKNVYETLILARL